MDLGEVVKECVRLITPERWYWLHLERLLPHDAEDRVRFFPVLLTEKDDKIVATYADMSRETFTGIDEICYRFSAKIIHFAGEEDTN